MADIIKKTTNKFAKGLVMDFSPENTKADVLTHALNATLLTFNGNELSLQNDMGNARVETAFLPEGYIPVGTCEYGGIIYIVSYNPLEDKSLIGCFPSPERNISSKELGLDANHIESTNFVKTDGTILNSSYCVTLKSDSLNPGDKFIVSANDKLYNEKIKDLMVYENGKYSPVKNPVLALNIVSIEDSGKIIYLNNSLREYEYSKDGVTYKYHIAGSEESDSSTLNEIDIDSYRNVLSSGYNVFKSKTSGKLAILAELVTIDSYSVTHSIIPRDDEEGTFDVVIHTDVGPSLSEDTYDTAPKLKYYYVQNSLGYLSSEDNPIPLFVAKNNTYMLNDTFLNLLLKELYTFSGNSDLGNYKMSSGSFNFPKPDTYHGNTVEYTGSLSSASLESNNVYTKFSENKRHHITVNLLVVGERGSEDFTKLDHFYYDLNATIYEYNPNSLNYKQVDETHVIDFKILYYTQSTTTTYEPITPSEKLYMNEVLYKLEQNIAVATESIKKDTTIEKFEMNLFVDYVEAKEGDKGPYYTKIEQENGDTYEKHDEWPTSGTVYISKTRKEMNTVGYDLTPEQALKLLYYYPGTSKYTLATLEEKADYFGPNDLGLTFLYRIKNESTYEPASEEVLVTYKETNTTLYYKEDYVPITKTSFTDSTSSLKGDKVVYVVMPVDTYVSHKMFMPNTTSNYISGQNKPSSGYPEGEPLYLYTIADFLPVNYEYQDVRLASIHMPPVVTYKNLPDLPFKYDYTVVPCMNYGRLDKLAVSNTVDFSNLRNFEKSNFTVWKYHIDGNLLSLTFGVEVYDTFETDKVDGLILEFYDLRGFAGSLEIGNKKSYSGTFTQLISLDTLSALSTKKYFNGNIITNYKHNFQIRKEGDTFKFNNKDVIFDENEGWLGLEDSENDCGTLYSNVIYGVKTYLRVTENKNKASEKVIYIPKKEFFLFTSPILNDYYYNVLDFSTIHNPKLDMVLTYKLEDNSYKIPYTNVIDDNDLTNKIKNGYFVDSDINEYVKGNYTNQNIEEIRYYKYEGATKLYLEVGLKKDYESIGFSCDPAINNVFSCKLTLTNDAGVDVFDIKTTPESTEANAQKLNYKLEHFNDSAENYPKNFISFENGSSTVSINRGDLRSYNFINTMYLYPKYITFSYNFIVGYKITIDSIKSTNIPATTVCALCHQNSNQEFNYSDFNIYKSTAPLANSGTDDVYYSDAVFFNAGNEDWYIFGMSRQVGLGEKLLENFSAYDTIESETSSISTKGKFNSGDPLKLLVSYIGKLSFGQPHAHGLYEEWKLNVGIYDKAMNEYWIWKEDIQESTLPVVNLVANTKNSINYNSEFISAIPYKTASHDKHGLRRLFYGLTPALLEYYNKRLLKTMRSVYAYNPDYDALSIKSGDVKIEDKNLNFTSNLISTNAKFEFTSSTFNDYLVVCGIYMSEYLKDLSKYSSITTYINNKPIEAVAFVPGSMYCGGNSGGYLLSQLSYYLPCPDNLEDELRFNASDLIVVKHSDGSIEMIKGEIDQKCLYGFEDKHLIELDVKNYTIDADGTLNLKPEDVIKKDVKEVISDFTPSETSLLGLYQISSLLAVGSEKHLKVVNSTANFKNIDTGDSSIQIETSIDLGQKGLSLGIILHNSLNEYFVYFKDGITNDNNSLPLFITTNFCKHLFMTTTRPTIGPGNFTIKDGYEYETTTSIKMSYSYCEINKSAFNNDYKIENQSLDTYRKMVLGETVTLTSETNVPKSYTYDTSYKRGEGSISDNSDHYKNPDTFLVPLNAPNTTSKGVLYRIVFDKVIHTVTRTSYIQHMTDSIIHVSKTMDYYTYENNEYKVRDKYQASCLCSTSITLNDLEYEPSLTGHRLFLKGSQYTWSNDPPNKIFYRSGSVSNVNKNALSLYTGPCFEPIN